MGISENAVQDETLDGKEFTADGATDDTNDAEPTPTEYTPNLEYTVLGEKRKFSEKFQSLIKDADTENIVRELYEKADGLDHYKTKLTKKDEEVYAAKNSQSQIETRARELEWLRKNNPREYCRELGINYHQLAVEDAERDDLPANVKPLYEENAGLKTEVAKTKSEVETLRQEQQRLNTERNLEKFNQALSRPEAKAIIESGIDDFPEQVMECGRMLQARGIAVTYDQAVERVVKRYAPLLNKKPDGAQPVAPKPASSKPTIPTTGISEGGSAAENPYKSIKDLRDRYKKL